VAGTRTEYLPLGGTVVGDPSCVSGDDGDVTCAFVGDASAIFGITFNPVAGTSSGYQRLGGSVLGPPSCVSVGNGDATCAVVSRDFALYGITFNPAAGTGSEYQNLDGLVFSLPSCARIGNGDVTCAAVGGASALYGITFNPATGTLTPYQILGGVVIDAPSCASGGNGDTTCVVVGTDSSLAAITFNPMAGTSSEYQPLGGTVIGPPSCTSSDSGDIICAAVGTDSSLSGFSVTPSPTNPGGDSEPPNVQGITGAHNQIRQNLNNSQPPVENAAVQPVPVPPLQDFVWDPTIAAGAQAWADRCVFEHSPGSDRPGLGENIAAGTGSFADRPEEPVTLWASEVLDPGYDYTNNACPTGSPSFPGCGHYTQMIWATSLKLGCGQATCPNLGGFWVCRYGPAGNINVNETRPYCTATQTTGCQVGP
jgi:hypothetical protein